MNKKFIPIILILSVIIIFIFIAEYPKDDYGLQLQERISAENLENSSVRKLYGTDSCIVTGTNKGKYETRIYLLKGDYLEWTAPDIMAMSGFLNILQGEGSLDYYVEGIVTCESDELSIEDLHGTKFQVEHLTQGHPEYDYQAFQICGLLDEYDEDYAVYINGKKQIFEKYERAN